jgi:glycosyltransferase involved in cell wall biosynthesis
VKIIILSHAYVVPSNRRVCERLAELYPETRVTVIVPSRWVTDRYGPSLTYSAEGEHHNNSEVLPLPLSKGHFQRYVGLSRALKEREPDIFYVAQERYGWSTLWALSTCKLILPQAITIGASTVNIEYRLKWLHHVAKERLFFKLCDSIIAMNSEAADLLKQHGYRKPTMVRHEVGADEEKWRPPEQPLPSKPFVIGYVGTLSKEKGVDDLIRAAANLRGDWRLNLIGDGPERKDLEGLVQDLRLSDRVDFAGYCPRETVMQRMPALHVLVLPSRTTPTWKEQFGLVLVEAMLSGVAVIGSDSGAIPEVIGDGGLIFPEGNIPALADRLQQLLDDPARLRELAGRGRQRALNHYSTTALATQFYSFCVELLSSHHRNKDAHSSDRSPCPPARRPGNLWPGYWAVAEAARP